MSGSGRETLPDVREWSRGAHGCPRVVERPPNVWELSGTLPDVRYWFGGPHGCPGVVGRPSRMFARPSRMSRRGREVL